MSGFSWCTQLVRRVRAFVSRRGKTGWRRMVSVLRGKPIGGFFWAPPAEIFSLLADGVLASVGQAGRIAFSGQGSQATAEPSLMVLSGLDTNQIPLWPFFWSRFSQAHLRGQGLSLFDRSGRLCRESAFSPDPRISDAWFDCRLGVPNHLDGPCTSLVSQWIPLDRPANYSHWLFEALPRLALLPELPQETKILVPRSLPGFALETLGDLGCAHRVIPAPGPHLAIRDFYFLSTPAHILCFNPFAVRWLRERWLPGKEVPGPGPLLYLHRPPPLRSNANEAEVCGFFRRRGWKIVESGTLSFGQQVALFAQARAVVGPHGAAFANLVWCRPGTRVLELVSEAYLNGCYEWLARELGLDYRFHIFPRSFHGEAVVNLRELERLVSGMEDPKGARR